MKNARLSHIGLAAAAYLAGLYGSTVWSAISRGGQGMTGTSTSELSTTAASVHCHGLKRLPEKNLLFAACRDGIDNGRERRTVDLIHVIDPTASTTRKLDFDNFKGPLVSQSFDVIIDPENTGAVYVHAINHTPVGPQVDVFYHILGSNTIKHTQSVKHPLVGTPSSLVSLSPMSFFITNGHTEVETPASASPSSHGGDASNRWSSVIHVDIGNLGATTNPSRSITTSIAFTGSTDGQDISQGMTEEELDYPLEWLTGDDVPACAVSAQKAV